MNLITPNGAEWKCEASYYLSEALQVI